QANANAGSTVSITASGTITLQSALPIITAAMNITGSGSANLVVSGNHQSRVFFVDAPEQTVAIAGLGIANGHAQGGAGGTRGGGGLGAGGALFVNAGHVSLTSVAFANNSAQGGAGGAATG